MEPSPSSASSLENPRLQVQKRFQQISLDAQRTGGASIGFSVDRGKVSAILQAWAALNPSLSYTQGLNEVAALLLFKFGGNESLAFETLQRLASPRKLGGLWLGAMPLYEAGRLQLVEIGCRQVPALLERLDFLGLEQSCYLPQAWHSLFAKWLPPGLAAMAVDDLLDHGMCGVLGITLAVFTEIEADVLDATKGDADISTLIGPDGYFTQMRTHLRRLLAGGEDGRLRSRWRELLLLVPNMQQPPMQELTLKSSSSSSSLTSSMVNHVQREAVLCLATSASSKHNDDKLQHAVANVSSARDMATRDELSGNHKYVFKMVVAGDRDVGKSCLVRRIVSSASRRSCMSSCDDEGGPTAGVNFVSTTMVVESDIVKLQIWDTAGGDSFISFTRSYFPDAAAVLLVYDVTCWESFDNAKAWLAEVSAKRPVEVVLVGNKLDLAEGCRQVPTEVAERFASQCRLRFFECSAVRGDNVETLFRQAAVAVHDVVRKAGGKAVDGVTVRSWRPNRPVASSREAENCRRRCTTQ